MARPIKPGLDYFPFDVDFFNDEKIFAIAGEFGLKGEITTIKLLCAVYRNGYYIEWSEMLKFKLLKELPGVSADLLEQILQRLLKWGFFDKHLFESASILTSRGIQRRYQAISTKMHRKNVISEYCLIDKPEPKPTSSPRPQKKIISPPLPFEEPAEPRQSIKPKPVPLEDSIAKMLTDTVWSEPVCMRYRLTPEQFRQKVANFRLHCHNIERLEHKDDNDARRHFCTCLAQGKLNDISQPTAETPMDYTYSGGFGSKDS